MRRPCMARRSGPWELGQRVGGGGAVLGFFVEVLRFTGRKFRCALLRYKGLLYDG